MIPKTISFSAKQGLASKEAYDVLIVPFWKGKKGAEAAAGIGSAAKVAEPAISRGDFKGTTGEILVLYGEGKRGQRYLLLGLGEAGKVTQESLRRAYATAARACHKLKAPIVGVFLPDAHVNRGESKVRGLAEGLLLPNYAYTDLRRETLEEVKPVLIEKVVLIGGRSQDAEEATKYARILIGVYLARDYGNGSADDVTAQFLVEAAKGISKQYPAIKTTIFDRKRIEKEKMGLLLAVNRGSSSEPAFIIMEYKGAPSSRDHTVLVGKGITYDTGGLSLKTTEGMATMKCDMCGSATVLGTLQVAADLGLKVNLTGVIPATDNCIGSLSYRPGDVYIAYSGKSVEIGNTDAEGRLILADALAYAVKKLKPTRIIDFATLTGSIEIALGSEVTGMFSNEDSLAQLFAQAGDATFERVWRMPLYEEYREQLKSDFADMRNIGTRSGGAVTAAKFLQDFVGDTPWVHFDIAATAYLSEVKRYLPKHATGVGVRLMIEFLQRLGSKS